MPVKFKTPWVLLLPLFILISGATGNPNYETLSDAGEAEELGLAVRLTEEPDFPLHLRQQGIFEGFAKFKLMLSREGELIDALLIEATHLDLGVEVDRVIHTWEFRPKGAWKGTTICEIIVNFRAEGEVISTSAHTATFVQSFAQSSDSFMRYRVYPLEDLDYSPRPLRKVSPQIPLELRKESLEGRVRFEFYIDPGGNVRLAVLDHADPSLPEPVLLATLQALESTKYETPVVHGRPVLAKVAQTFHFDLPPHVRSFEP